MIGFPSAENFASAISPDGKKMLLITKDQTTKRSIKILERPDMTVPFDYSQVQGGITQRLGETLGDLNPRPKMGEFEEAITALEQGVKLDVASENSWCKTALENARQGIPTP